MYYGMKILLFFYVKGTKGRKRKSDAYKKTSQQQNNASPSDELINHPNNDSVSIDDNSNLYVLENISDIKN